MRTLLALSMALVFWKGSVPIPNGQKFSHCSTLAVLKRLLNRKRQSPIMDRNLHEIFHHFCSSCCITYVRSQPYNPQSNGQAERFIDTFKRALPNRGDIEYISPFVPNNTKWYSEKWIVPSRNTYGTKVLDHTGCPSLTKKDKGMAHPKIKQKYSRSTHQCLQETTGLDNQTGFQVPFTGKRNFVCDMKDGNRLHYIRLRQTQKNQVDNM